jgi:hypothetical protein
MLDFSHARYLELLPQSAEVAAPKNDSKSGVYENRTKSR